MAEGVKKRFCRFQVGRLEPFTEPVIDGPVPERLQAISDRTAAFTRAPSLSDATCDFLHCLDNFRMVGLAGIAKTLGKIVWANAVQLDARHREDGVEVVQHGD